MCNSSLLLLLVVLVCVKGVIFEVPANDQVCLGEEVSECIFASVYVCVCVCVSVVCIRTVVVSSREERRGEERRKKNLEYSAVLLPSARL